MFHAYMAAFTEAAQLYAIDAQPDLNSALRIPGMLSTGDEEELGEAVTKALLEAAAEAVGVLNRVREREGAATAEEMRQRYRTICSLVVRMEDIRASAVSALPETPAGKNSRTCCAASVSSPNGWPRKPQSWRTAAISPRN